MVFTDSFRLWTLWATPTGADCSRYESSAPSRPLTCLLAPFSSGCGRQSVCEKYCCEHWVLSHSAHTANCCYSEKNKTQTYSKREHFSSSPYYEPQAPARRPAARNNSTPRHTGQCVAGHPRSVRLGSGHNKTRLNT